MEEINLDVQLRDRIGSRKVKALRREDFIPGIVYGGKKQSTAIKVQKRTYERIIRQHGGQSVVLHLNVMEGKKKLRDYSVIVKEEQHDPVFDDLLHLDFMRISLTEEIEVKVPIETKGEAVGVKQDGGSLDQALWELDVVCLPTKIPEKIEVDVTELKIGDAVHVREITLPEGVKTKHDPETMVVSVVPPMKEEPIVTEEEEALTEPEVIKEKKEEAEEAKPEEKAEEKPEKKPEEQAKGKPKEKPEDKK